MPKIPQCDRCLLNAHSPHMVCTIHRFGVDGDRCLDFRKDFNAKPEELWEPEGATYYNGELILQPKRNLTLEEQMHILDTHPLFTGVCPECGYRFPKENPRSVNWDCPVCGKVDDSV